jgi:hypothetical protein
VYDNMDEYSKALSYYERALDIFQASLPPNHPSIKTVKESIEIVKKKCKWFLFCFENKRFWKRKNICFCSMVMKYARACRENSVSVVGHANGTILPWLGQRNMFVSTTHVSWQDLLSINFTMNNKKKKRVLC